MRKLIDQLRDGVAFDRASFERFVAHGNVADKLSMFAANGNEAYRSAHRTQDIENGGTRGIQPYVVNHQIRFRKHHRRRQKKYGGRKITGNRERAPFQARPSMNADCATLVFEASAKFSESQFRMVSRAHRFRYRSYALCE